MTPQERIRELLEKSGIPAKEIHVFGSQILITCYGRPAAERFAILLGKFATVRGIVESVDDVKDKHAAYARLNNPGLVKSSFVQRVWRVGAFI